MECDRCFSVVRCARWRPTGPFHTVHARSQARALRLRSGLRSLRLWAKSSAHWRDCRSKELRYANRMTKKAAIQAWKNTVYPLGLRVQRGPSIGSRDGEATRNARVHVATNKEGTKPWRAKECLKVTTAATAQDWTTLLGCSSLVLLRLPMIGKHMRRVLYVWRKLTKKGKRVEYIRSILPQKVGLFFAHSSIKKHTWSWGFLEIID